MAVSTDLKTPLTLVKDQELSIPDGVPNIRCFNDSNLSIEHYRTIPNDQSDVGRIQWANRPSVLRTSDGDYAVAVSMFEYIYGNGRGLLPSNETLLNRAANENTLFTDGDGRSYYVQKDSVTVDGPRVRFRKIVWVKASDLVLGSVAQQQAIADAEAAAQEKYLKGLANGTDPKLGNTDTPKASSTIWIILVVLLALIGSIWAIIAKAKKNRAAAEAEKKASGSNVNIIRIPKNT